ncbi:MAG: glycoside hydrolase family 31 protein [Flavitalea sp.]
MIVRTVSMTLILFTILFNGFSQNVFRFSDTVTSDPDEKWFGAAVNEGHNMPFADGYTLNLYGNNAGNQASPLLLSTKGRYIWSDGPIQFSLKGKNITVNSITGIKTGNGNNSLKGAYKAAEKLYFPASGTTPNTLLFEQPQYNSWVELNYTVNQADLLIYAHKIIDNGFPPGVFMIDDNWAPYYGKYEFRKDRFPDAKKMMDELHALGFKVMLWVCPFISPDTEEFRTLLEKRCLLFDNKGDATQVYKDAKDPLLVNWWNGFSAELDCTNPDALLWIEEQFNFMQHEYGIDGFKLDAGDMEYYPPHTLSYKKVTPNEQCELWGSIGLKYTLNEYRAMWKQGGQALVERLRDKRHDWNDVRKLIPHTIAAGLLGYPFTCPDMIGGGELFSFVDSGFDQQLVVRSAQISALMPMMQFSIAPWRVLDSTNQTIVKKAVALRKQFTPYILQLADSAAITGEPIVRSLEYVFPHQNFESIQDQFMLGDRYMVAPVVKKENSRQVVFPKGKWKSPNGNIIKGPVKKLFVVPLNELLWFERV